MIQRPVSGVAFAAMAVALFGAKRHPKQCPPVPLDANFDDVNLVMATVCAFWQNKRAPKSVTLTPSLGC